MNKSEEEIWRSLPGVPGVEVSTLGNVRTLDRLVSSEEYTRFTEGRILKQYKTSKGYLNASIPVDGKWIMKRVHRLVALTFIPNPDNLPMVNHKNCVRDDNRVSNLEFCTPLYNIQYREKYGEALGHPIYAINLKTHEVLRFKSQSEAGRELGVRQGDISAVIRGRQRIASGYWFIEDDGHAVENVNSNLHDVGGVGIKLN